MDKNTRFDDRSENRMRSMVPVTLRGMGNDRFDGIIANFSSSGLYVESTAFTRQPSPRVEIELKRRKDGMPCSIYGHITRLDKNGCGVALDVAIYETSSLTDMLEDYAANAGRQELAHKTPAESLPKQSRHGRSTIEVASRKNRHRGNRISASRTASFQSTHNFGEQ
jgi:hypothetical protein